jgi:hypothetical protein
MTDHSVYWKQWQQALSRWQLRKMAATILESAGLFHPFIAQLLLIGQPMLSQTTREEIDAMVSLLEEPQSSRAFAAYLMKENEL